MKYLASILMLWASIIGVGAQTMSVLPAMMPAGGSHEDNVDVTCTFPEGCVGGKYWFDNGRIQARVYTGPIHIEKSTTLSIAGINAEGRIITDVVTYKFDVNKVTKPYITTDPEENTARESFYATKLIWNNATTTELDLAPFKSGGKRYGERVVWLMNDEDGHLVYEDNYNALWLNGNNSFKAYIYKNYRPTEEGKYSLHIAKGVFVIDGERYDEEVVLNYKVGKDELTAPVFTPAAGTYKNSVEVSIEYPTNAFYQFYSINDGDPQLYEQPFKITKTSTVKAWGNSEDFSVTIPTTTAQYIIETEGTKIEVLPTPRISSSRTKVTITESDQTASIKYWFDDDMNTAQLYTAPFEVTKNCKISAVAFRENGRSLTADYYISAFEEPETEFGTLMLRTPDGWPSVNVTGMSPNGRFVTGYTDTGGTPYAFLWDITSGKAELISTQYNSYSFGVSNDGTIVGWHVDENPLGGSQSGQGEADIFKGYFRDGEWTPQPSNLTVNGITASGNLFGASRLIPAVYDTKTQEVTTFSGGSGTITCVNDDETVYAGYLSKMTGMVPVYWKDGKPTEIKVDRECAVKAISGNGEWLYLDNSAWGSYYDIAGYRYNTVTQQLETLHSMGAQYPSRYEWMYSIADDGTLYGVYDRSLLSHEAGAALVYTVDGTWVSLAEYLQDADADLSDVQLLSCKFVSANQKTMVLGVFPVGMSADDTFSYALAVQFDAKIRHAAATNVVAKQMYGVKTIKVTWSVPVSGAEEVTGYKVLRNGEVIATLGAKDFIYYDRTVEDGGEYAYTIVAIYRDGVDGSESYAYNVKVTIENHSAVESLTVRQSGLDDAVLRWAEPVLTLPKLQYFNEKKEFAAFGTAGYDSEWAIRIPASDLNVYNDLDIRTFQFIPTGRQEGYEFRLYKGNPVSGEYDAEPFYKQTIDPASLKFGAVNTIELATPQQLPQGNDLYVALYIKQVGNNDMLGTSSDGFRSGYTDLCRIIGVHDRFTTISVESSATTEVVLPLGVGLGNEELLAASSVQNYLISDNGSVVTETDGTLCRLEHVAEGNHSFEVRAKYKDGEISAPETVALNVKKNEKAYVAVTGTQVADNNDGTVSVKWNAPLNDDKTNVSWGDMNPQPGLVNNGYPEFSVMSFYPVNMTAPYGSEYEITHVYFYPTADALYGVYFDDYVDNPYFNDYVHVTPGQINYIELPEPVDVGQSSNFRIIIDVYDCPVGQAPLAYDSSNKSADGFSNMFTIGDDWMSLSEVLSVDEHPNWLMGMVLRRKDAPEMPLVGYNVAIDGKNVNSEPVTATELTTEVLAVGDHKVAVDVVYDDKHTVKGEEIDFNIIVDGIENVSLDAQNAPAYNLGGYRIIKNKHGKDVFIMGNKKYQTK